MELISIVTVVLNDAPGLLKTSHSLLEQTYKNWEQIIIYGPSSDETEFTASELASQDHRIRTIKEAESGIYTSMNQGLDLAKGRYVWFMNAGDSFYDQESLHLGQHAINGSEVAYVSGGYQIDHTSRKQIIESREGDFSDASFAFTSNWCHQAIIFDIDKVKLLGGYDTKYRYAADYDLILRLTSRYSNKRIPAILATFDAGGAADSNLIKVHLEKLGIRKKILKNRGSNLLSNAWFFIIILKLMLNKLKKEMIKTRQI